MYQPMFPLRENTATSGTGIGMIEEVKESIKQDFYFLLLTYPGEWPGQPDLGVGILKSIFEPENSPVWVEMERKIRDQVSIHLSEVKIGKIKILFSADNDSQSVPTVTIYIQYSIDWLGNGIWQVDASPSQVRLIEATQGQIGISGESSYRGVNGWF